MALDEHFDASRLAGNITRIPRLPVAGFWVRLIAFVVDWIVLTFFFYVLTLVGREFLLAMGRWSSTLAALLIFAYFWLGDGPVGKGRTVGKALMGLRAVNAVDGQPISLGRAAARAAILLPPVIWAKEFIIPAVAPSPSSALQVFLFIVLPQNLMLALYGGQIVHTAFNPTRQGIHDAAAGSLVLGADHGDTTWSVLEEQAGTLGMERARRARQAGWIGFITLLLLTGYMQGQYIREKQKENYFETNGRLTATLDRYHVEMTGGLKRLSIEGEGGEAAAAKGAGAAKETSGSKPPAAPSRNAAAGASVADRSTTASSAAAEPPKEFEVYLLHRGRDTRPIAGIRTDTDKLSDWLMDFFREQQRRTTRRQREAEAKGETPPSDDMPEIPAGTRFTFHYQEYLDLVLYTKGYTVLSVERKF